MPVSLPSRVFSSETLMAGVELLRDESGLDDLAEANLDEMQAELERLQACPCVNHVTAIYMWTTKCRPESTACVSLSCRGTKRADSGSSYSNTCPCVGS